MTRHKLPGWSKEMQKHCSSQSNVPNHNSYKSKHYAQSDGLVHHMYSHSPYDYLDSLLPLIVLSDFAEHK